MMASNSGLNLSQHNMHHFLHGVNAWTVSVLRQTHDRGVAHSDYTDPSPISHPTSNVISHTIIGLIQEPYTYNNQITGFPSDFRVYSTLEASRARACIVTTRNVTASLLLPFTNGDVVAIRTRWKNRVVVFASCYMPHGTEAHPSVIIMELVDYCRSHKYPLIVGTDSNSHHTYWGSSD